MTNTTGEDNSPKGSESPGSKMSRQEKEDLLYVNDKLANLDLYQSVKLKGADSPSSAKNEPAQEKRKSIINTHGK